MFKGVIFVVKQIESTNTKPCNYHPLECNTFWNQIRVHSICKLGPCSEHYGSSEFSLHTWLGRLGDKKMVRYFSVILRYKCVMRQSYALFCVILFLGYQGLLFHPCRRWVFCPNRLQWPCTGHQEGPRQPKVALHPMTSSCKLHRSEHLYFSQPNCDK